VLTGGPVLAPDGRPRYGRAVLVRDGLVEAVVPDRDVRDLPAAEVIDLHGRLLLPGFIDAHAHPVWGGLERLTCDLSQAERSVAAYQEVIARVAAAHPEWPWISGGGWSFEAFPGGHPTAAMIDAVVRERPVVLLNSDHHGVWANTRALREAGIDARTPDPPDGWIERDASGAPTGMLHEGAADLITVLLPEPSAEIFDAALVEARRVLLPLGITGWADAILGDYTGHPDPTPAYLRAAREGFDLAVSGALWWDRERGVEQVGELVERRALAQQAGFPTPHVKIMVDGIVENQTAAMVEPYLDPEGVDLDDHGLAFVDRETLLAALPRLEDAGFGVHLHAIGDRAVRDSLDSVAAAVAARQGRPGPAAPHQVAHLQVVRPEDVARFGALGVVATCQPLWACLETQMSEFTLPVLGDERGRWQYPFASIVRAGGALAIGSDWPVSSADPWEQVHVAVNRVAAGTPEEAAFLPGEVLPLATALQAFTTGSARAAGLGHVGMLAPGQRADLVVASADPFLLPPQALGEVRSALVLLGGQVVAADGALV
jgi:predicted amidohydrolase YtcJ